MQVKEWSDDWYVLQERWGFLCITLFNLEFIDEFDKNNSAFCSVSPDSFFPDHVVLADEHSIQCSFLPYYTYCSVAVI